MRAATALLLCPLGASAAYNDCSRGASAKLPQTECNAWGDLYAATAGDGWSRCAGTKNDPCKCEGTCNEAHTALVAISLAGSNLVGALPPSIGNLAELRNFTVFYNQLSGPIPSTTAKWTKLEVLSVGDNQLNGALPNLPYGAMKECNLFWRARGGSNQFACPFPAGVVQNCVKFSSGPSTVPSTVPVVATDCSGTPPPAAAFVLTTSFFSDAACTSVSHTQEYRSGTCYPHGDSGSMMLSGSCDAVVETDWPKTGCLPESAGKPDPSAAAQFADHSCHAGTSNATSSYQVTCVAPAPAPTPAPTPAPRGGSGMLGIGLGFGFIVAGAASFLYVRRRKQQRAVEEGGSAAPKADFFGTPYVAVSDQVLEERAQQAQL